MDNNRSSLQRAFIASLVRQSITNGFNTVFNIEEQWKKYAAQKYQSAEDKDDHPYPCKRTKYLEKIYRQMLAKQTVRQLLFEGKMLEATKEQNN